MIKIISLTVRCIAQKSLSLILIAGILTLGFFGKENYDNYQLSRKELPVLKSVIDDLNGERNRLIKSSLDRINQLKSASLVRVNLQLKTVTQEIKRKQIEQKNLGLSKEIPGTSDFIENKKLELGIIFLKQEQSYLSILSSKTANKQELETLRQKKDSAYQELIEFEMSHKIQSSVPWFKIGKHKELYDKNHIAYENYQRKLKQVQNLRLLKSQFVIPTKQIDDSLASINQHIENHDKNVGSFFGRIYSKFSSNLEFAIRILISVIFALIILRAIFYYIFAPLASRRPPICILPEDSGVIGNIVQNLNGEPSVTKISAVSIPLNINKNQELLIHPEYIQSSSIDGRHDTKWLLSNSLPMSSILSGMLALTRIRTDSNESIVISSTKDPLTEVGILSLPQGSAMVLQPQCLIGVLQNKELPVHITRHWRIFSLQAWLTLQLRYLVFHGPITLIIKGCRGIRVEKAGNGRRISQAATIGFSAKLKYSTTPRETFFPYLTAQQALLNDNFVGESGFYVYEELPRNSTNSGITRGLEGMGDAIMKVFGI